MARTSPARTAGVEKKPAPASAATVAPASPLLRARDWLIGRRFEFAALVLYAFVLIAHAPWVFLNGRFWAEEATVHLAYAWNHSFFNALFAPQFGYCNLVANIGAIIASNVPLEDAPHYTETLALFVQLIPPALILFGTVPGITTPLRKLAAILLLLIAPANPEMYLNSINSQSVLCAAAGIVLVSELGGRVDRICKWVVLVMAGLSGVASSFLAPFFWVQWWFEGRRRERLTQAIIITCCALIQFIFITQGISNNQRHLRFSSTALAGAMYGKFVVMPLVPTRIASRHLAEVRQNAEQTGSLPGDVWFMSIAGCAAFLSLCGLSRNRAAMLLGAITAAVALLSLCGSRDATSAQQLLAHITHALRYYYAPQCFFLLGLLASLGPATALPLPLKIFGSIWMAATLLIGMANFACGPLDWPLIFSGPSWSRQVEEWRKDPSRPLAVWPQGWQFNLTPKP